MLLTSADHKAIAAYCKAHNTIPGLVTGPSIAMQDKATGAITDVFLATIRDEAKKDKA